MELGDYLRAARRRRLLIVGTLLVALAFAAIVTWQTTKQYASVARVMMSTPSDPGDAYQAGLYSAQRAASYADILNGQEVLQQVIDDLNLDTTASELHGDVDVVAVRGTVNLTITVTDPNPTRAKRINQAMVAQLQRLVLDSDAPNHRIPLLKASVVVPPSLPKSPVVAPQPVRNAGLAIVLGLLLGFGLAVLREILDTSAKQDQPDPALGD